MKQKDFYSSQINELNEEVARYAKKAKLWILVRLISFLMIPVGIYTTFDFGVYSAVVGFILLLAFLFFVRKSAENKERLFIAEELLRMNEQELKLIAEDDFSSFGDGSRYKDPAHAFSYDMDVFGPKSGFQYLNRTVTKVGEEKLAAAFTDGSHDISSFNGAVEELSEHIPWTQAFRARGIAQQSEAKKWQTTRDWGTSEVETKSWMKAMQIISPIFSILATVAYNFDLISGFQFALVFALLLFPVLNRLKKTNQLTAELGNLSERVQAMNEQLELMSQHEFNSERLKHFQEVLFHQKGNGQEALRKLAKILKEAEYRYNILVAIALNFYFAWDIRVIRSVAAWKNEYGSQLKQWETILFEMEVLISAATFRYNRREETSYAKIPEKGKAISLLNLGHPLISKEKLISNNYEMKENESFAIVTGPNMAGKSTFLRSVGVNLMLAKAGFPVLAKSFVFPNVNLYSSMRTADDLSNESSYFHAELMRLRFIVDAIERGEKVFIILDEILKGTNSKDKEEGSWKFLQRLVQLGSQGIIATHDLKLTELADANPALKNVYFDTTITGDDISFDYTLNEGVAQNMNASFLLRKMGLIGEEPISNKAENKS